MLSRNQWHNFTPGLARDYRLPASISYTSSLFETACRNVFQWRWPGVLEAILSCSPPPRPSCAEGFRLYGRSVIPTISSLSSNWDKIRLTPKNILPTLQCLSFTVACLWSHACEQYMHLMKSFFFSQSRDWAGCFRLLFPCIDPDWFSNLLFVEFYDSCIPIASASLAAFIISAEIITLVASVMKCALSSQKGLPTHSNDPMSSLIPEKCIGFWIPSMIFVWECNEAQRDDLVEKKWIVFLASLFQNNIERIATGIRCIYCPGVLGPYTCKKLSMCHSLIKLAASRTENQPQTHDL